MIVITGGAGFIGSFLNAELVQRGYETVIVDWLGDKGKWRNIAAYPPADIVRPESLDQFLAGAPPIRALFHVGAISETTALDGDLVWDTNFVLSKRLWHWCASRNVPFIYASSAATYGSGDCGFDDDPAQLSRLRPLNLYGWSKHVFDKWVQSTLQGHGPCPPQWAGLKFFNVYGPNEFHKGKMISVVKVKFDEASRGGPVRLFRSDRADIADGAQRRDFIWVGDVAAVMLWLFENPSVSGLFNLGTGVARTYLDLAHAVCDAVGAKRLVEFIDMPDALKGQYQSFTQANMTRLRAAGFDGQFTPLEEGIRRYVRDYLMTEMPFH
jgi:ADP-L-glycero-D-manno-heptose 6-epimerase